jgi:hypothetical protein
MLDPAIVSVLAILHVAAAAAWFGALVFFISIVGPGVRSFTPAASLEFLTKVGPRQLRFFIGSATATILFGVALLYAYYGSYPWPTSIEVGFGFGLLAYLIALGVTVPAFRNADKVAHQIMATQGPPPPELAAKLGGFLKRGNIGAASVGLALVLTLIFMVDTGFPI